MRAYLDCNATTSPSAEVIAAMTACMESNWANPSSIHRAGSAARAAIDSAREQVAELLRVHPRELVFVSGGTESANLAIRGTLAARPNRRVIISSRLEHPAVRETIETLEESGLAEPVWIPHANSGELDYHALAQAIAEHGERIALASFMWVNNETGVVTDIARCARICHGQNAEQAGAGGAGNGVLLHTDATQTVGKLAIDLGASGADLASCSAHKLHGPRGVGALFVRRGASVARQMSGGPQERDRRAGTENTAAIVGFGQAAREALSWLPSAAHREAEALHHHLESALLQSIEGAVINGAEAERCWTTTSVGFESLAAEAIVVALSERGVSVSAGAACSSGSLEPSPVLLAMGVPEAFAHGSIRLSISRTTSSAEVEFALEALAAVVAKLRASSQRPRAAR